MPAALFFIVPVIGIFAIATVILAIKTIHEEPGNGQRNELTPNGKKKDDDKTDDDETDDDKSGGDKVDKSIHDSFDGSGNDNDNVKIMSANVKKISEKNPSDSENPVPPSYDSCMKKKKPSKKHHSSTHSSKCCHHWDSCHSCRHANRCGCHCVNCSCNVDACYNRCHPSSRESSYCTSSRSSHNCHLKSSCNRRHPSSTQQHVSHLYRPDSHSQQVNSNGSNSNTSSYRTSEFGLVNESSSSSRSCSCYSKWSSDSGDGSSIGNGGSSVKTSSYVDQWVSSISATSAESDTDSLRTSRNSNGSSAIRRRNHGAKQNECFICAKKEPDSKMVTLMPCKHNEICIKCIEKHLKDSIKCPFCIRPIKSYQRDI